MDVLSFGGTKNGLMMGEAVIFFNKEKNCAKEFMYLRKQGMQLFSKMRYLSAQYTAYGHPKIEFGQVFRGRASFG